MKETRCSLRLAPKTQQRLSRFGMIRQNSFKRHDVAPVSRPINDAYATASDFFENLVITYSPLGVPHIEFSKHVLKRFF